jgi:hypothetical protein
MVLQNPKEYSKHFQYATGDSPFIDYILEDKSSYPPLSSIINPRTGREFVDPDNDFLIGDSGGILMKIDFVFVNTNKFSPAARFYDKHKTYTLEPEGSPEYEKYYKREFNRRIRGVEAKCKLYIKDIEKYLDADTDMEREKLLHYVRITGDHYNYLNYSRIERTLNAEERKEYNKKGLHKINTVEGFPAFWDGDYWDFKIDELAALNQYNICEAKARRKGFSYKKGSKSANTLNSTKNVTVIMIAYDTAYLTDKGKTSTMVKVNLDWYETQTEWRRGYLSENFDKGIELGYKKSSEGHKAFGYRSKLLSIATSRNASAAIGGKALEVNYEEAGKFKNLQQVLDLTLSNMESGAATVGMFRIFGTGGELEADWVAFKEVFYNPRKLHILAMENIWDRNSRKSVCGFFFPQIWNYEPYIEDGNSMLFTSYLKDKNDKLRAQEEKKSTEYNIYLGQRANSPAEAFSATKENIFHSPELTIHLAELTSNPDYKFYTDGWYILKEGRVQFLNKTECINSGIFKGKFHDYIKEVPHIENKTDVHGCIREFYPPVPNDGTLYFISADTYRIDKSIKGIRKYNSLYAFQVWMRIHDDNPYKRKVLAASYTGRLDTMEENDRLLLYASIRYNCKVLIEAGTGETIPNFKKWGYRSKLLRDPTYYLNKDIDEKLKNSYGIFISDGEIKFEGLRILRDLLYSIIQYNENGTPVYLFQTIYDISLIEELNTFDFEGNFDRISAAIVAAFEYQKDSILIERAIKTNSNNKHVRMINRFLKK